MGELGGAGMIPGSVRNQRGFGLLETLTGLVVLVVLALVGTKAYRGVVQNQKEASQVKALTDAVTETAERLSGMTVKSLTQPGSRYLQWSEPASIGSGEYNFRFRSVPRPEVGGVQDTGVVGLEVEVGQMAKGNFVPGRMFATLIAPQRLSRDSLGAYSTDAERAAEAAFYSGLRARIAAVSATAKVDNQVRLNSYSCYDKGECCGFMEEFFLDPKLKPDDGLAQKCHYRCALGGNVSVPDWNSACRTDFCGLAPWKTKAQCCAAIVAGECKPGSVCANVCIDCVKEDGSGCAQPACDEEWFNDLIDCNAGTMCDGSPIPATLPGWGDVGALCKLDACRALSNNCSQRAARCCDDYWTRLARGEWFDPRVEICASISRKEECCDRPTYSYNWEFQCGTDGKIQKFRYQTKPDWYCGSPNGGAWDATCAVMKGCATVMVPNGADNGCTIWSGTIPASTWEDPFSTTPRVITSPPSSQPKTVENPVPVISKKGDPRVPSGRDGTGYNSAGGSE